ncbi:MAG: SIMPL domain-containing protein [Patescibacteria group bacterium]
MENFKTQSQTWLRESSVRAAVVASLFAVLISLILISAFFKSKELDNSISVTGSARKSVVADSAKLSITMRRAASFTTLTDSYKSMYANTDRVKAFILKAGFAESDIAITPPSADQIYDNNGRAAEDRQFDVRQYIDIRSSDIAKIEALSRSITNVSEPGLVIEIRPVEYMYTKLADIRGELFAEAIKDARVRAEAIASTSGGKVGKIKSAATGVVQVLTPQSVEVSDYGTVDTSSINKEVMVTARASFYIK